MMACTVDSYPSAMLPNFSYLQEEQAVYYHGSWLQTEIYHDFILPATVCCPGEACGPAYTPTMAPVLLARPQYKPTAAATSSTKVGPKSPAWWESGLAKDIHQTLRSREEEINRIHYKSPQLYFRREMVEFVTAISRDLNISTGTRHLAVRLMDLFMDGHNVMEYRLRLMALTCLLIAAKFEEPDDALPTIEMLQHSARMNDIGNNTAYTRQEFHTLELYILKYFKWCVSNPSAAHFIDYYQHVSITNETDQSEGSSQQVKLENQMKEYCMYFLELSLKDETFLTYKPSEIAASIVCVARICTGLSTAWNPHLEEATCYSLESLQPIASYMLSCISTEMHH